MRKQVLLTIIALISLTTAFSQEFSTEFNSADYCQKGYDLYNNYQFDKAIEKLAICYKKDNTNIECLNKIASCNFKLGRYSDSKNNYYKILEYDSVNLRAINQLGLIYSMESHYSKSIEQYQLLASLDSSNSFYFKQIGLLSLKLGNVENAIRYLEKAYTINTKDMQLIEELSNIYEKLDLYSKANNYIDIGLQQDSNNVKLLLCQSKIAYSQKEYEKVIYSISSLLEVQNDTSDYMMKLLGISHFHLEHNSIAITLLNKVIENEQGSEIIQYYLALSYQANGEFENSIIHFELAIDEGVSDNISSYYTNLAKAYEQNNNFQESIRAYKAAYKSSKNTILLYHLARNYDAFYEDKKTAIQYYERYLAANDTGNVEFKNYSKHRISELNEVLHFGLDTLN